MSGSTSTVNQHVTSIADLRAIPHWVVFALVPQPGGKPKKVPYVPGTDRQARVNDPKTWRTYAEAAADAERTGRLPGVALTPAMNITLLDVDGHIDYDLVATFDSYAEVSVSGGLHILVRGRPPENRVAHSGIEVYPKAGNRFVVLTGNLIDGRSTIEDRSDVLARLFPARPKSAPRQSAEPVLDVDDQVVIERVLRMRKGRQLHADGDWSGYPSGSEGDLGLLSCYLTAGATGEDQLNRLFVQSALYQARQASWDKAHYRKRTLAKALNGEVQRYEGWDRPKNGTVTGKPQDAETADPLAATGTDDLPDDMPSLKQMIRHLTRRIEDVEQRAQAAEQRAQIAEQRAAALSRVQSTTARIVRNKALGQERFTGIALSHRFASLESLGKTSEDGLHPITLKSVAEVAGVSEDAASRHIATLVKAGVLRKEIRWQPEHIDPETGEITPAHKRQYIGPASGNVIDFVEAVANLQPDKPKTWGGRADRCLPCTKHPHAGIVKRVTFHCAECDEQLGQLPDEPYVDGDAAGQKPQDAEYPTPPEPRTAASKQSVATSLISPTVRFSQNHAEFDAEGTAVAAAWLQGQSLPGFAPQPDHRTDVAYGARGARR